MNTTLIACFLNDHEIIGMQYNGTQMHIVC